MTLEKIGSSVNALFAEIEKGLSWKKCITCGQEWDKLTPNGECPNCNPDYLDPFKVKKESSRTTRRSDGGEDVVVCEEEIKKKGCFHCSNSGNVSMIDRHNSSYAFACICEYGDEFLKHSKARRWNGQSAQRIDFKNSDYFKVLVRWNPKKEKDNPKYFQE